MWIVRTDDEQIARVKLKLLRPQPVVRRAAGDVAQFPVLVGMHVEPAHRPDSPRVSHHGHDWIRKQDRRPFNRIDLGGTRQH